MSSSSSRHRINPFMYTAIYSSPVDFIPLSSVIISLPAISPLFFFFFKSAAVGGLEKKHLLISSFIDSISPIFVKKKKKKLVQGVCGCERFSSSSIMAVARAIIKRDGYAGLMRGWKPRMLFHAPAAAICWSAYESSKSFFHELNNRDRTQ